MSKKTTKLNQTSAQTAIELAVFGAIVIFVIGIIVRTSMSASYQQNQAFSSMRQAMTLSFEHSEGIGNGASLQGVVGHGNTSRNFSSIILVEDRLNADAGRYGAIDRIPFIASGGGTHSRNLFMPIEPNEDFNLSRTDVIINKKHFVFTTAGFKTVNFSDVPISTATGQRAFYTQIPNHPGFPEWCDGIPSACGSNLSANLRFDLDRSDLDRGGKPGVTAGAEVNGNDRILFSWQWYEVLANKSSIQIGDQIDVDQDLKEESVIAVNDTNIVVTDAQEGDLDFSITDYDTNVLGFVEPGLQQDGAEIFTYVNDGSGDQGTYFLVEEGKLYNGKQYIRTASKKDQVDLIVRGFKMSNNTGRFCSTGGVPTRQSTVDGLTNPVEACNDCFATNNIAKTCFDTVNMILHIRSRIVDRHGRRWTTDTSSDAYIDFNVPSVP